MARYILSPPGPTYVYSHVPLLRLQSTPLPCRTPYGRGQRELVWDAAQLPGGLIYRVRDKVPALVRGRLEVNETATWIC
ncbi:hypothetical protein NDU88_006435 [Pleurodeles waltl]|uniref:Uncharacterized protein n=1 Tax=Pleurodeles waltl TaxID=8319 RepID=A0AAV7UL03_PLEWA|nr:hypothetical protein NDU88_006435 [Pleurodeles waltl]